MFTHRASVTILLLHITALTSWTTINKTNIFQVDGDTDTAPVQEDFKNVVKEHIAYITTSDHEPPTAQAGRSPVANGHATLEQPRPGSVKRVGNGVAHGVANGVNHMANGVSHMVNGYGPVKAPQIGNGVAKYAGLANDRGEMRNNHSEVNFMDGNIWEGRWL